ncbi:3'-5' exonuclease [Streptomyces rimosus]|uniref:3'-5' exonuclease n=1 Tax=Streptomyces rimosus TaxID=1927 RepID=UPI001F477DA1|nr:3'-5' exonuclease [Streptomyces rimosus]
MCQWQVRQQLLLALPQVREAVDLVVDPPGRAPGRMTLTTYHSAKGREFDVVILPGLINKHVPYWGRYGIGEAELRIARRNFYVALTRAREEVVLLSGSFFTDAWSTPRCTGPSIFVTDILGPDGSA